MMSLSLEDTQISKIQAKGYVDQAYSAFYNFFYRFSTIYSLTLFI